MQHRPLYFILILFALVPIKNLAAQDHVQQGMHLLPSVSIEENPGIFKRPIEKFEPTFIYEREKNTASNPNPDYHSRATWLTIGNIAAYAGSITALSVMWYADYPRSGFHFFDDNDEWLQVDKAGHLYTAYLISRTSNELWRWAGLPRKKRIWLGGLSGVAYQSVIEILDGFSAEYGFSTGDFAANVLGSAIFISQELAWDEQKIRIKYSALPLSYSSVQLEQRADKIFGETNVERLLKDYNRQTYWVSANVHDLLHAGNWPEWLNVAVGYGATGMFGGRSNVAYDDEGNVIFDRGDIQRRRQWYLSPDVDFSKIKTRKKGIKVLLFILDSFKFPAPALEFSGGKFKGHLIFF